MSPHTDLTHRDVLDLTFRDMLGLTCCDMFPVRRAEVVGSQRVEDLERRLATRLDGAAHKSTPSRGQLGAAEKYAVMYREWSYTLSRGVAGNTLSRIQKGVTHCHVVPLKNTLSRGLSQKNTVSRIQSGVIHTHTHCHTHCRGKKKQNVTYTEMGYTLSRGATEKHSCHVQSSVMHLTCTVGLR